ARSSASAWRRSRAGARCTPGTTCSRPTRASSASRRVTRRSPAGTRSPRRGAVTVYATLLGSPDRSERNADLTKLLDWGFSRYRAATVVMKGHAYAGARVGYGRKPVALVAAASLTPSLRVDFPLVRRVVATDAAELPVSRGQSLG